MKLLDVPKNTKIRILEDPLIPPASRPVSKGEIITFHNLDGMYSYCTTEDGGVVHLNVLTNVEIVEDEGSN